mgnify:CR=1 FL=1
MPRFARGRQFIMENRSRARNCLNKTLSLLLLAGLWAFVPQGAGAAGPSSRALWVWDEPQGLISDIVNGRGAARAELFSFCAAPNGDPAGRISTLYFSAVNAMGGNQKNLRAFLADAHSRGLEIELLAGNPQWAMPDGRRKGEKVCAGLAAFNAAGAPAQRFDGMQLDVEPHAHPDWPAKAAALWDEYILLHSACQSRVRAYNGANRPAIRLGAAIPRWYDSDSNPVSDHARIQDAVDYAAIMDYTDDMQSLVADARNELEYANAAGKKVVVGVETSRQEPETITFFEEGWDALESALSAARPALAANPSFEGYAIHYYSSYRSLPRYGVAAPAAAQKNSSPALTPYRRQNNSFKWAGDRL